MTRLATIMALLTGVLGATAFADDEEEGEKEYALRGVTELGGTIGFSRASTDGATATAVDVSPFIGWFLAPSFCLVGTIDVHYLKPPVGDSDTDVSILAGAGYFLPAGPIYIGPQAQIGYGQIDEENAFVADGQILLKIKIGQGGLADIGGGYRYAKLFGDAPNDYSIGTLAFRLGFSVWF